METNINQTQPSINPQVDNSVTKQNTTFFQRLLVNLGVSKPKASTTVAPQETTAPIVVVPEVQQPKHKLIPESLLLKIRTGFISAISVILALSFLYLILFQSTVHIKQDAKHFFQRF